MVISGIFPALVTPFRSDESVLLEGVKENIRRYNKTALAGYVVLGSTGESVMLRQDEADSVLAAVREAASPDKLLIAGTGAESTAETIARTKRAAALAYPWRSSKPRTITNLSIARKPISNITALLPTHPRFRFSSTRCRSSRVSLLKAPKYWRWRRIPIS